MTAKRMAIRNRVREILLSQTDAQDRVYTNRREPYLTRTKLPAVAIYALSETASKYAQSPIVLRRDLRLAVEIITEEGDEDALVQPDDQADAVAQQVESLMEADPYLGFAPAEDIVSGFGSLLEAVDLDQDASGDRTVAAVRLTYVVQYDTELQPGDVDLLAPFVKAGIDWDLPGKGEPVDASDVVELEQE